MTTPGSNRKGGSEGSGGGKNFQPERYVEQRNGAAYLPLKWRLAWLRAEHPHAVVQTKLVQHQNGVVLFRAKITLPEGGIGTGWGSSRDPFAGEAGGNPDTTLAHITEAENQALGRALAVLGYGIEYATDFDAPDDGEPIPLRESEEPVAEEASIEVPMDGVDIVGDEEAEEVGGAIRMPVEPTRPVAPPPVEEEEEDEEEEEHEEAPKPPTPLRTVYEEPSRFNAEPTPLRPNRPVAPAPNPPTPITSRPTPVRRPGPTAVEPPAAPPPPPTPLTSAAVEDRLKEVNDERLRLAIKQIFHEARRLHNLSEDAVDRSSQKRYGVPVNRLTLDQANEYLERIKTAPRSPRK